MTTFYYDKTYPEDFSADIRTLAEHDPSLLDRLNEGPRTSGQLELQLLVTNEHRLQLMFKHAAGLASKDPEEVLASAEAFTKDMQHLSLKSKTYRACQSLRPPIYRATIKTSNY